MREFVADRGFIESVLDYLHDLDPNCNPEIRENYSGRGMYGKTTIAIITEVQTNKLTMAINMAMVAEYFDEWLRENEIDDCAAYDVVEFLIEFADHKVLHRQDSMGLGTVYY